MLPSLTGQTISWQISNQDVYSVGQNFPILQYEQQNLISPTKGQHAMRVLETRLLPGYHTGWPQRFPNPGMDLSKLIER
jgi:hypothetical protein